MMPLTTLLENSFLEAATTNAGMITILFLLPTAYFFLKKKTDTVSLKQLWTSFAAAAGIALLLKFLIHRERPIAPEYFIGAIPDYSFPSLQTALAWTALPVLWKEFPRSRYFFFLYALLIAWSRLYLQEHYWSDVIAGAFLGLCIGLFVTKKIK